MFLYKYVYKVLMITAFIGAMLMPLSGYGGNPKKPDEEKIHISAETLEVDSESKYAEFSGNVRAAQGNILITADKLRIFYDKISDNKKAKEDTIKKIIAQGHVRITFDDKVAETEEAVYTTKDRVFVLSGENSTITSGGNSISGSKITLYRTDGRIKIESSKEKRVEAVFYSEEKEAVSNNSQPTADATQ